VNDERMRVAAKISVFIKIVFDEGIGFGGKSKWGGCDGKAGDWDRRENSLFIVNTDYIVDEINSY
jgi:hypothetical protein